MKSFNRRRCVFIVYLMMSPVSLQIPMGPVGYPMPMPMPPPMPPPMYAMPAPPPMPIGVPVPIPMIIDGLSGNGGRTTTTTERYNNFKNVLQIPLPVEISIYPSNSNSRFYPAPFPGPLPPAPGPYPAPYGVPLPMPMIPPPPLLFMRPKRKRPRKSVHSDESCCNKRTPKPKHDCSKRRSFRRVLRSDEIYDNELVKPILTYVSEDGRVKMKQSLSNDEAVDLMDDNKSYKNYNIVTGEDPENKQRFLMVSNNNGRNFENPNHQRRQVILRTGSSQHGLREGRKELVFRPPFDKKISNLSVSFQISDQ